MKVVTVAAVKPKAETIETTTEPTAMKAANVEIGQKIMVVETEVGSLAEEIEAETAEKKKVLAK